MSPSDVFDQSEFSYRTIVRKVSLFTPALLDTINQVMMQVGHQLEGIGPGLTMCARCDSSCKRRTWSTRRMCNFFGTH